jgi:hypothetical protein
MAAVRVVLVMPGSATYAAGIGGLFRHILADH